MNVRSYIYVAAVVVLATTVLVAAQWHELLGLSIRDIVGLCTFITIGVLSELFAIEFSLGSYRAKSSVAFVILLAATLTFQPVAVLLAATVMQLTTDFVIHRRKLWISAFNVSQGIVAIDVAITVFHLFGGTPLTVGSINVMAFAIMAVTLLVVNILLFSLLFALRQRQAIAAVFRNVINPGAANLLYGLFASPIAILMAIVYDKMYIGGLLLMLLPLLLVRYSYLSKVQLQQANRDLLKVLIKVIETRDPYTSGHSMRVSSLARLIAEDMGLSRRQIEQVETVGLLHDIGKIDSIYAAIIQKPSDLTEEELRVIKTHAVKGAEFLKSVTSLSDAVIEGVRHHHERYDGMGYPDRLRGDAIPLYSRIIMICDAIDAMLSDRPYRSALPVEAVERELLRCAGTQFDPEITRIIVRQGTLARARELVKTQHKDLEVATVGMGSH